MVDCCVIMFLLYFGDCYISLVLWVLVLRCVDYVLVGWWFCMWWFIVYWLFVGCFVVWIVLIVFGCYFVFWLFANSVVFILFLVLCIVVTLWCFCC